MKRKPCRTAVSSSTTKTALSGISCRLGGREVEKEDRTKRNAPRHSEAAAVRLNNRAADREPHPHAERFGGDERIKQRFHQPWEVIPPPPPRARRHEHKTHN